MVKIDSNSIRIGNVIEHQGKLWRVVKSEHTKPGKGGAFNQMELKSIPDGIKLNERFRANENIEQVRLDQKEYQYLYDSGDNIALMNNDTYEQIELSKNLLGEDIVFLQDGMNIIVESYEEKILSAQIPEQLTFEISETEAVVKGQTAASSNKPAILENGVRIMVPVFIAAGDRVVIRTTDRTYLEREK